MNEIVLRFALILTSVAGFLVSAHLTVIHLLDVAPVCANGSTGCSTVQANSYSEILSIPVAALVLLAYGWLIISSVMRGQAAAIIGLLVAIAGTLFSAYLTYLELFVIYAICKWCVVSAILIVIYLTFAILRVRNFDSGWEQRRRRLTNGGRGEDSVGLGEDCFQWPTPRSTGLKTTIRTSSAV